MAEGLRELQKITHTRGHSLFRITPSTQAQDCLARSRDGVSFARPRNDLEGAWHCLLASSQAVLPSS